MPKILVHNHSCPDLNNKITLGMVVTFCDIKDGYDVSLFLAAVGNLLSNYIETEKRDGESPGDLKEHLDLLKSVNTSLWVTGILAKAVRNYGNLLEGFNAQFVAIFIL